MSKFTCDWAEVGVMEAVFGEDLAEVVFDAIGSVVVHFYN